MNIAEVLQKIGYTNLQDFGADYRTAPLYRPSDNNTSLSIDKQTGVWYDFALSEGGCLAQLIRRTLGASTPNSVIDDILNGVGCAGQDDGYIEHRYELLENKKFDKALISKLAGDHSYWVKRGVSSQTLSMFQGGITHNGRMSHRYVFPILDANGDLVGFSGRRLSDTLTIPKWKHLGAKSLWQYPFRWNRSILERGRRVILVESIGDMLALWEADIRCSLVTFGTKVGSKLIETMLGIDATKIIIAFNNDVDGRAGNDGAIKAQTQLKHYFDENQIVIGVPEQKDFGSMTREQIDIWATKYL